MTALSAYLQGHTPNYLAGKAALDGQAGGTKPENSTELDLIREIERVKAGYMLARSMLIGVIILALFILVMAVFAAVI